MSHSPRRVLVFGADGLRPDLIDPEIMPNLAGLARGGVVFSDHHAVYPSHTRVNASTFASGATPGQHGIVANTMLVPNATEDHIIDTGQYQHLDALANHDQGRAIRVDTLGDVLKRHGKRVAVAGTGSSGSNVLWTFNDRGRIVNTGSAYGIADLYDLRDKLGEIPPASIPNLDRMRYATSAVTEIYLDDPDIAVINLWLAEPDSSLHKTGIGSPETQEAMRGADECLGVILDTMERRGIRDQFDILFLSDHGHSTVRTHKTLREFLIDAREDIGSPLPPLDTASDYIYATPGTEEPTVGQLAPLVEWLHAQPWLDVVLGGLEGTGSLPGVIPLEQLWNGQTNGRRPLLAVSPAWSDAENDFGIPGTVSALTTQAALKSSHGSLSPYDMHATFVANGPSFNQGLVSGIPTGATDVMPTILSILGLGISETVDGRVVDEALVSGNADVPDPESISLESKVPGQAARAVILHKVGSTTYVHGSDQGTYRPAGSSLVATNAG